MPESSISATRLNHVQWALKDNPELHALSKLITWTKGKKSKEFPEYVWKVTEAINAGGADPCSMGKKDVVAYAAQILSGTPGAAVAPAAPAAPAKAKHAAKEEAAEPEAPEPAESEVADGKLINLPVRVAIYTLLASAYELTAHDRKPGHTEIEESVKASCELVLKKLNPGFSSVIAPVAESAAEEVAAPSPAPAVPVAPPVPSAA